MSAALSTISTRAAFSVRSSSYALSVHYRFVQSESPPARARVRRDQLERCPQHVSQDHAQMCEELVVTRRRDPVVEAQVGGQVGVLVFHHRLHRLVRLGEGCDFDFLRGKAPVVDDAVTYL
jgi:hypothetical protein